MQYCPNCKVKIRGRKACCPLCRRELKEADLPKPLKQNESGPGSGTGAPVLAEEEETWLEEDPFVQLPSPRVSFMLMVRTVTFLCVSAEILLGAAQIISGGNRGWVYAAMLFVLIALADFRIAVFYRSNLIRMLTTQAYIIMGVCLLASRITKSGSWALTWVVPGMFLLLIAVTFLTAKLQDMELHEYILYPAFDVLMSLLQIIPVLTGSNPFKAPAVICIALMLILVSSLIIFRGRMLREAAVKYLHV